MFKKLLKYDFQSLKRVGFPMLVTMAALTAVVSIYVGVMIGKGGFSDVPNVFEITATVFAYISIMAILVCPLVFQIMIYENFYRTLTTDEGYLTFTLPVKAKQIIFSKLTNGTIWTLIIGAAATLSALIIIIVGVIASNPSGGNTPSPNEPTSALTPLIAFLVILFGIVSYFTSQLAYFIIIFWGSTIFKSQKSSNVIWLLIIGNFVISAVTGTFSSIISVVGTSIGATTNNPELGTVVTLIMLVLLTSGLMVGAYFLLKHLMEKKVNLP